MYKSNIEFSHDLYVKRHPKFKHKRISPFLPPASECNGNGLKWQMIKVSWTGS